MKMNLACRKPKGKDTENRSLYKRRDSQWSLFFLRRQGAGNREYFFTREPLSASNRENIDTEHVNSPSLYIPDFEGPPDFSDDDLI